MSLMYEMNNKAFEHGVPLSVHIDVTYRCNERCVHCYLDHDDHGEMTTAEIKGILDQLAEAGTRGALIAAITALPEREAQVIQLYYVEELNLEEIGLVLGVGPARICQIKKSAHDRLKKALARVI